LGRSPKAQTYPPSLFDLYARLLIPFTFDSLT
jgi:hypothetical protein